MPAMMNRAELQRLANQRIQDAKALCAARRWSAAYYLAGYGVECALKACIAKLMKAEEFPDKTFADRCWTHDIERLVGLAGLKDQRDLASSADADLKQNGRIIEDWDESRRYARSTKREAQELLDAITDSRYGVLPWIKSHW
jgi:HEPN domain-containing protein